MELTRMSIEEAVRRGFANPEDLYRKRPARKQDSLDGYCRCGHSNLWDERCPVCGKRPYTD